MRLFAVLYVAVVALVLVFLQPFPVLHDYPEWMYQGFIANSLLAEDESFSALFQLATVPVPNAISQLGIAALNTVTSPVVAGKIWLLIYLLLALVVIALSGRQRGGAISLLFTLTVAFGPGFWNGYINFQFGLMFFALFVLLNSQRSVLLIFLFSLLIYFSHASVFAGFVCFVVVREFLAHRFFAHRRVSAVVALLPSLFLLGWYATSKVLLEGTRNIAVGSVFEWLQYKLYTLAKQGAFHNFIQPDGQSLLADLHPVYLAGFGLNFLTAILIGFWLLVIVYKLLLKQNLVSLPDSVSSAPDQINSQVVNGRTVSFYAASLYASIVTVAVMLLLWLLAGKNSFGVVNLGERFLVVALMLLLLHVECPRWIKGSWVTLSVLSGAVTLLALLMLSQTSDSYKVSRTADAAQLEQYMDDIYKHSRHKYFNHRLFIYASLGQYLLDPVQFGEPPQIDHQSSIVLKK